MKETYLYINGQFQTASDQKTFESLNPATQEVIAKCALPSPQDIDDAVESAGKSFKDWSQTSPHERATWLEKIADKMQEKFEDFAYFEMIDSGATIKKARLDITSSIKTLRIHAEMTREFVFESKNTKASQDGISHSYLKKIPIGVCALITPWNFPIKMVVRKLAPALSAGCSVVLKSAQETPITAFLLAEIINEIGFPKGVFNLISGGAIEARLLLQNKSIRKISFTGSTLVGKEIMRNASERLQKISLELGGKSASIILEDANLEIASLGVLYGFLFHSGQSCSSGTRLLIHEKIYSQFVEKLLSNIKKISVGLPHLETSGYGPVINEKQFNRIMAYIHQAKENGSNILCGGKRLEEAELSKGFYIAPTLIEAQETDRIFQEEIFGPVAVLCSFSDAAEAIRLANHSNYGLAGSIWTQDISLGKKLASQIETGTVWINDYHALSDYMPFGGFKESGLGREMGEEGIDAFLESQHLCVSDMPIADKIKKYSFLMMQ